MNDNWRDAYRAEKQKQKSLLEKKFLSGDERRLVKQKALQNGGFNYTDPRFRERQYVKDLLIKNNYSKEQIRNVLDSDDFWKSLQDDYDEHNAKNMHDSLIQDQHTTRNLVTPGFGLQNIPNYRTEESAPVDFINYLKYLQGYSTDRYLYKHGGVVCTTCQDRQKAIHKSVMENYKKKYNKHA